MGRIIRYTKEEIRKLKRLFERYKEDGKYTTKDIARELKRRECSVRIWLKRLFGDAYSKVSKVKYIKCCQKISDEEIKVLFGKYKGGSSIRQLALESRMSECGLFLRFVKSFGKEYAKIAEKRSDFGYKRKKGKLFEEISLDYLKFLGLPVKDVRRRIIFKDSLKRPDFLIDDKFIEVKAYPIYPGGYKEIIDSCLGKQLRETGKFIKSGMIISLLGFSPEIKPLAERDGIELVGPLQMKQVFYTHGREDLIKLMSTLVYPAFP